MGCRHEVDVAFHLARASLLASLLRRVGPDGFAFGEGPSAGFSFAEGAVRRVRSCRRSVCWLVALRGSICWISACRGSRHPLQARSQQCDPLQANFRQDDPRELGCRQVAVRSAKPEREKWQGIAGWRSFRMPIRHPGGRAPNKGAGKGHRESDPVAPETEKLHQPRKSCHFPGAPFALPRRRSAGRAREGSRAARPRAAHGGPARDRRREEGLGGFRASCGGPRQGSGFVWRRAPHQAGFPPKSPHQERFLTNRPSPSRIPAEGRRTKPESRRHVTLVPGTFLNARCRSIGHQGQSCSYHRIRDCVPHNTYDTLQRQRRQRRDNPSPLSRILCSVHLP